MYGTTTSAPDAIAAAAAEASASAAAAAEAAASERANAAEADRDAYAARSATLEAEKAAAEDAVARAADAAARDAAALAAAESRILDLTAFIAGAEARLQSSAGENAALLREGRDRQVEALATEKRLSFVEMDRVRMAAELAEIKAQHNMDAAAHAKEAELARAQIADLTASLEHVGERAAIAEERVNALDRQVADLQADRERARSDAQREIDNLNDQLEIHRENSQDTQARMRELKEVIAGMSATMRASEARAVASGTLGTHADGILRHVQAELDSRLDELEAERKSFELARSNERKMAIAMEALIREKDTAIALAQDAENRARSLETEVEELHRRNDRLERRLILAGDDSTAQQGIVTSPGMFDNGMQIAPFERPQLQLTPSKQALDGILKELGGIKRRHDELMTTLTVQRDMYRDFS
jgi:trimeric autotransporter adhesin